MQVWKLCETQVPGLLSQSVLADTTVLDIINSTGPVPASMVTAATAASCQAQHWELVQFMASLYARSHVLQLAGYSRAARLP